MKKTGFTFYVSICFLLSILSCSKQNDTENSGRPSYATNKSRLITPKKNNFPNSVGKKSVRYCSVDEKKDKEISRSFSRSLKISRPIREKRTVLKRMTKDEKEKYKQYNLVKDKKKHRQKLIQKYDAHFYSMRRNKQNKYLLEYQKLKRIYKDNPSRFEIERRKLKETLLK